jgi:hypothetical protein
MIRPLLILALLVTLNANNEPPSDCIRMNFLPMPNEITCGKESAIFNDPCKIFYHVQIEEKSNEHVGELIEFQMKKSFRCNIPNYVLSPKL